MAMLLEDVDDVGSSFSGVKSRAECVWTSCQESEGQCIKTALTRLAKGHRAEDDLEVVVGGHFSRASVNTAQVAGGLREDLVGWLP